MSALVLALALFAAQAEPAAAAPAEAPYPAGAPRDDYQFVGWCYGALRGYLDLHDQVMPEVTRIETTYRKPGSSLSEDLKVYADMQRESQVKLKTFQSALTAAEKASLRPINAAGALAVQKGRGIWSKQPDTTNARIAQAWMSWTLPARCDVTAKRLKQNAALMGPAFKVNAEPETPELRTEPQAAAAPPEATPETVETAPTPTAAN